MIKHTALFTLKHAVGSPEELDFLQEGEKLGGLSMVKSFQLLRQVSDKNPYRYCFSMEFDSEVEYQEYNNNKIHREFVEKRWNIEVAEFMEADYVAYGAE